MVLESLVCPNCGCRELKRIDFQNRFGICPACNESFVVKSAEYLARVEVDRTKDLQNFREHLRKAVLINDVRNIAWYARNILDLLPTDFSSTYYYAYAENALGEAKYLRLFYSSPVLEHTKEEMDSVIDHILHFSDLRDHDSIERFLSDQPDIDRALVLADYRELFQKRVKQEELYDDIPRDVFICHRSTDQAVVDRVLESLENDGNKCWVSYRNLCPNDSENYWTNIEKAIRSCKIFLVVSGSDAMLSKDVKREMEIAKELGKPRLEYKIDHAKHTTFFKYFFDGLQWVEGFENSEKQLSDLRYRVYSILEEEPPIFDPPKPISPISEPDPESEPKPPKPEPPIENVQVKQKGQKKEHHNIALRGFLIFISVICVVAVIIGIGSYIYYKSENRIKFRLTENGYTVYAGRIRNSLKTKIEIPESYKGKPVTAIAKNAFSNCSGLTSVTIPNSVTSIGDYAFSGCKSLTSVTIPNGVTSIGDYAFSGCKSLTSITIPDSVTSIGNYAFSNCSGLTKVAIGNSVTSIGYSAFEDCTGLTSVTIPNSVMSIGYSAFEDCTSLMRVTIPSSVTSIGNHAFYFCTNLQYNTFDNAKYLGNEQNPYVVLVKATSADITSCNIHADTKLICDSAFSYCSGLTSITIPNSVTSIGDDAFSSCTGLKSIIISNSVTSIGSYAFRDCKNLQYNTYGNAKYLGNEKNPYVVLVKATSADITSCNVHADTKVIYGSAFSDCTRLTSIIIPDSVTSIGYEAFSGCTGLTSITIPNSVTSIGYSAFSGCTGLTSITIPNSVTSIGYSAFEDCTGLTSIIIPNSVMSIGSSAFSGCTGLTSVTIPNSVMSIGGSAFSGCTGLTSITIPNSVTSIGYSVFKGCTGLTSVTIGNGVISIGYDAFSDCTGLTSITYQGTKAQWKAISKDNLWNYNTGNYTIHCTDGNLAK